MGNFILSDQEMALARKCLEMAAESGASDARISLNKSLMDLVLLRDGELDKVTHSGDRALQINIFADGRFGSFSTNRMVEEELRRFISQAVDTVRMLAPDPHRRLPDRERIERGAVTGYEMGMYDPEYEKMEAPERIEMARKASICKGLAPSPQYRLISEETEYSDSVYDTYIVDSKGLECRHLETSFEIGCEMTIEDPEGNKYSGYWWDASPRRKDLTLNCCEEGLRRAVAQIGAAPSEGGKFNMVVENEVASRLVSPLLSALGGYSIEQKNSFLADSLGKKVFPEGLTIVEAPRAKGRNGAKLFDSEGVSMIDRPVISDGRVDMFYINTYMSGKMGMEPTTEGPSRTCVMPFGTARNCKEIMEACGSGYLVTGFNGGNSNSATGDFSYGIEGFRFEGGKPVSPVGGMVVTGNFLTLWNNLIYAGEDSRPCMNKQIPTLAFKNVDFSA